MTNRFFVVAPLCQQAMDLNFDGLIVESHCNPDCAWSDASQQVTPDVLDYILNLINTFQRIGDFLYGERIGSGTCAYPKNIDTRFQTLE